VVCLVYGILEDYRDEVLYCDGVSVSLGNIDLCFSKFLDTPFSIEYMGSVDADA
jgi:hypothetical protein